MDALANDARFNTNADRVENYDVLMPHVRAVIARRPAHEWLNLLRLADVPVGKINTVSEALADPHLLQRNFIVELEHPSLGPLRSLATPIHMSMTPLRYEQHPPLLGEHTHQILESLGYTVAQIKELQAADVI